jgi:hypothetical protein
MYRQEVGEEATPSMVGGVNYFGKLMPLHFREHEVEL